MSPEFLNMQPQEVADVLNSHYGLVKNKIRVNDGDIEIYDSVDGYIYFTLKNDNDLKELMDYLASNDFRKTVPNKKAQSEQF